MSVVGVTVVWALQIQPKDFWPASMGVRPSTYSSDSGRSPTVGRLRAVARITYHMAISQYLIVFGRPRFDMEDRLTDRSKDMSRSVRDRHSPKQVIRSET